MDKESSSQSNQEVFSHHAKTFYLASLFLPKNVAQDAACLYRFAREVDDMVDEQEASLAIESLNRFKRELAEDRAQEFRFLNDFKELRQRLDIPSKYIDDLVAGVTWDTENSVIQEEDSFYLYCYQVAGVVGLMMCCILRIQDRRALVPATDLGIAMQMTNICRDILEDAGRNRMYIPLSWMKSNCINIDNINSSAQGDLIVKNVVKILHRAEKHYESAISGMCYIPVIARFSILVAAKLYRAIGLKILKSPQKILNQRVYLSIPEKIGWIIYCCFLFCHPKIWKKENNRVLPNVLPEIVLRRI